MTAEEKGVIRRIPQTTSQLIGHIPRLEGVARIILYQNKNYDGTGYPLDSVKVRGIPLGSRLLRILSEMLRTEAAGIPRINALETLAAYREKFEPNLVEQLLHCYQAREHPPQPDQATASMVKDLRLGIELKSDVFTKQGLLVMPAGCKLSQIMLKKLENFAEMGCIKEPIFVK